MPGWIADPDGPLTITPAYLPRLVPWLVRFLRASCAGEVERITRTMRALLAPVFDAYEPLLQRAGGMDLIRLTGCLYVYSSEAAARRWAWGMDLRRRLGVELRPVGPGELGEMEPDLRGRYRFGLFAPAGTPEPILGTLHAEIAAALESEALQAFFAERGFMVERREPDASMAFITPESGKWGRVVEAAGPRQ